MMVKPEEDAETKAAREARLAELSRKREETKRRRQTEVPLMVTGWLAGIGKDIRKVKQLEVDASSLQDPDLNKQYSQRFADHVKKLGDLRDQMEDSTVIKTKSMMDDATKMVSQMKKDAQAFEKLKNIYSNSDRKTGKKLKVQ